MVPSHKGSCLRFFRLASHIAQGDSHRASLTPHGRCRSSEAVKACDPVVSLVGKSILRTGFRHRRGGLSTQPYSHGFTDKARNPVTLSTGFRSGPQPSGDKTMEQFSGSRPVFLNSPHTTTVIYLILYK